MHFHTRKMKLIFCVVKKKRAHELTNLRGSIGEEGRNLIDGIKTGCGWCMLSKYIVCKFEIFKQNLLPR